MVIKTYHVGVDLHRNNFTYCVRNSNGEETVGKEGIGNLKKFARGLGKHASVALEATGNTWMFCRVLKEHVGRLVIVNPNQFKVISRSVKKTDRNDAKKLAEFLEKDMLPEVRMKNELQAKVASLAHTREKLVQLRNKINNLFASQFIQLKREELSSEKGLLKVLTYHFDTISDVELRVMVDQIRSLNKSIKGIGSKGAATLLSVIGNVEDFSSAKRLAAYIGIVPRVSDSNDTSHHGRITKLGSKIARTTLVQCALITKRYYSYLFHFHEEIKMRRGGAKANIALVRKFLEIIYRTLKNNWIFEDFTRFKIAKT